jgi:CheY-like chemotaxis protein
MALGETLSVPPQESPSQTPPVAALDVLVLLVEDDLDVREAMADLLAGEGLRVVVAGDGREGLDLLRAGLRPSVIVLDLTMPRMDGWDFREAQMADRDLKDIPVVVVSAGGFRAEKIRSDLGDVQFLGKPFEPVTLLDAIAHCCQAGRQPPGH